MFAANFAEWIVLLAGAIGLPVTDLASLIDPADYFQTRNVEVKVEKMLELAAKDPADGPTQMAQLLALRWLAQHPAEAKKADQARETLTAVAEGKKAQDLHGFAKEYAQKALAKLDGKPAPAPRKVPADSVRTDALRWFPTKATVFGAVDFRASGDLPAVDEGLIGRLLALTPGMIKGEVYRFADQTGNVRLDRLAMAFEWQDAKDPEPLRIWIRLTGAGDVKRLSGLVAQDYPVRKVRKGSKGETITILSQENQAPVFAFIGETELIIAGHKDNAGNHLEVLEQLLETREGKRASVLQTGPFAENLKKVPDHAHAVLAADFNDALQKQLAQGVFPAFPRRIFLDATRTQTVTLRVQATAKDANEAKAIVMGFNQLKEQGLEGLKKVPAELKVPAEVVKPLENALRGARLDAQGTAVRGTIQVPGEAIQALFKLIEEAVKAEAKP
jgi:hypothetical protein